MKYFLTFDIFGIKYNFLRNGNSIKKTKQGVFLTILYSIIVIILFLGFGIDLYMRKNPKISFESLLEPYKENYLCNNIFIFAYRIEDIDAIEVRDDSIVRLDLIKYKYELIDGKWNNTIKENINNTRCSDIPNIKEKEKYYNITLKNWYCINFENQTMGGNWDGNFVNKLNIETRICVNNSLTICQSKENIINKFYTEKGANLFFSYLYLERMLSFDNYSVPIKSTLINRYEMLDLKLLKKHVHTFKKTTINDDRGWLFSNVYDKFLYSTDNIIPDFRFNFNTVESILFSYHMYMGRRHDIYSRCYVKIQEVIALLGGFSKFTYLIISIVYTYFSDIIKNFDLMETNKIYNFNNSTIRDSRIQISDNKIDLTNRKIINLRNNFNNSIFKKKEPDLNIVIRQKMCCKLNFKKSKEQKMYLLEYEAINKYHKNKFDATTYLSLIKEFDIIKRIFLEDIQQNALEIINSNYKIDEPVNVEMFLPKFQEYVSIHNQSEINKKLITYFHFENV